MDRRLKGDRRYEYDREAKTVKTGKKVWQLREIPAHVIYEWIREDRVFKGLLEDWVEEQLRWKSK